MSDSVWQEALQIHIEHTDCTGVVYHAKYLNFLEMARSKVLEVLCSAKGMSIPTFYENYGFFVVHSVNIKYNRAMKLSDKAVVQSDFELVSPVRMRWHQKIIRQSSHEQCVQAVIDLAFIDHNHKLKKIPAWLLYKQKERVK